jgi:O-antigen/teichoic acid export membrane protein
VTDAGGEVAASGLRGLILRGFGWKAASQVLGQAIALVATLTLAHLLSPHDYGLAAMALVLGSLGAMLSDLGLGTALIQRPTLTEEQRSTAFWATVGIGLALTLGTAAAAGLIARAYHEPAVEPLIAVFSLNFVLSALGSTQGALLIRDLRFRALELRTLVASVVAVVAAIVAAVLGAGAWALIVQGLVMTGVSTVLLWASSPWRPRLLWSRRSFAEMRGLSGAVFGTNVLFYLNRNVDNVLISRFLGPAALGLYSLAYNAMLIPLLRLVSPIGQVLFPAFSRMEDERAVGALWLRVTRVTAAITVPAFVGLAVVAPDLVDVLLGPKWDGTVRILQVLAWVGILQAVAWETQGVLTALGRARTIVRYATVSAALTITAFAIGVTQGLVAVAVAYAIVTTVLTPFYLRLGIRATGLRAADFVRSLAPIAGAAATMGVALVLLRVVVLDDAAPALRLVLLVAAGFAVYLPLVAWLAPQLRAELRDLRARRAARGVAPGASPVSPGVTVADE